MRLMKTSVFLVGLAVMAGSAYASAITPLDTIEQMVLMTSTGAYAEIDIDAFGLATCLGSDCTHLTFDPVVTPHGDLVVKTKINDNFGGFEVSATGKGGQSAFPTSLQNLSDTNKLTNLRNVNAVFTTLFTDTDYCGAPGAPPPAGTGGCFGDNFTLAMSNLPDTMGAVSTSPTRFTAFIADGFQIPAGTAINAGGSTINGIGTQMLTFGTPLPGVTAGSVSTQAETTFKGIGTVITGLNVATATTVPEPSTLAFFGIAAGFVGLKLRRRKV